MCGLIGVSGTTDAARDALVGLMNLQHRGQDGAGILTLVENNSGLFNLQKGSGLVENVFSERAFKNLKGRLAIGHTRYATIGRKDPNLLQPFLDAASGLAIGHNGNIVNVYALRDELLQDKVEYHPATGSDSEVILKLLSREVADRKLNAETLFSAVSVAMHKLVGSYAVVGLDGQGGLFGFRDPDGIRPLVLGKRLNSDTGATIYALASESVALSYQGYAIEDEIGPGEAIYIDAAGNVTRKVLFKRSDSACMFESVYFSRVESEHLTQSIYEIRFALGLELAELIKSLNLTFDVVVPVPETSRSAAIAIAESLNLPFRESLIKNRYVNRTFILDGHDARQEAIRRKLSPIASEIRGKRCLVIDDSIVRGTTAAQIIELMRQCGAKEVTMASTCPQIKNPCYYGIDFPSQNELVAYDSTDQQIAQKLGADRVIFQTLEGLRKALTQESLCTGCLTGTYPTDISCADDFQVQRLKDRTLTSKS
jgi:amidophosphoribosyltransferase